MTPKVRQSSASCALEGGRPTAPITMTAVPPADPHSPLAVPVNDGARMSGLGRSFLYELMAAGELPFVRIGKRRLLLVSDLAGLLQRHRRGGGSP
jgi:excisionase family DNA binding protein